MSEAETLILAVEKYPCLWNIHDNDYHTRDVKDLAWENVFKEVIKDWDACTKKDKDNKGAEIKNKWTHIRDYFRKNYKKNKNAPTGSAAKKVKKYIYSDLLYFLIPVFDKRYTEGNYESHIDNSQESETQEEKSVEQVETNIFQPPSTPPANSLKRSKKDVPSQILGILQQNQQKANQKVEVEDDDMKFLLSFRTHMKHMNENQKIDFKLGMLQLVKNINTEYNYSPPSSSHSYANFSQRSVTPASSRGYSPSPYYIPVPKTSPMSYQTQTPLPLQNSTKNYQSASKNSRVVINSITHLQPPRHIYTPLHGANLHHVEDTDAATYLIQTQRQEEEEDNNINKYLNLTKIRTQGQDEEDNMLLDGDNLKHAEDTEAATYLIQTQRQEEEEDNNINKYLNFKH